MDKQQARNIIKETFENPFQKDRFTGFVKNLLNQVEDARFTYRGNYIPDAYKAYVAALERIGKYADGRHKIDILVVRLKNENSLERARTMQRNFIAWYLNGSRGGQMKDGALVAFVSPGEADWRFSLVKMDYRFEESNTGKIKVKEEFTPARRWSFLVGSNEASHTAQSRLIPILADDEHNPTLKQLENAFDIETVSKEFFLKYRDLFIRTKEALDEIVAQASSLKHEFETKGVDTVNFAKKLLGQIVFLYFLQKKGWFGVERDAEWGSGSKHFLRQLFAGKHGEYKNFFNDILEPLFYEALRIDRRHDDDYYSRFNCKIPFLNGGLFDPIGNYDWVHTDIIIPNELFSNTVKTKEGDTGDGILDVFDRYNFTVKEDEPLEKEVAIDPELLGKAYEKFNAIRPDNYEEYKAALKSGKKGAENKFNKKFGVYYTPREIVHYMCQQSLINYLHSVTQPSNATQASQPEAKPNPGPQSPGQDACDPQIALDTIIYFDPDAPISKKQRNLPHWQQKGTAYFVTFRLFDSIPKEVAESIRKEREQWLKSNHISDPSELRIHRKVLVHSTSERNLGFINPNSILLNSSYSKIRRLIVNDISKIIKLPDSIFENAVVETIILMLTKTPDSDEILGAFFRNNEQVHFEHLVLNSFKRRSWLDDNLCKFNIFISPDVIAIISKIEKETSKLEDYVDFSLGITPYDKYKGHSEELIKNRAFHSPTKLDNTYVPLISGKNILRYSVTKSVSEYLKYGDWLGAPRQKKFFTNPRIIVRQIVSGKPLRIYAGYTENELYHSQVGFSVISKEKSILPLKYLLALLNSKLMNFYHTFKYLDIEKETFQKILIENCKLFPIKDINSKYQEIIISLVDRILSLTKDDDYQQNPQKQAKVKALEQEIDQMVYQLGGDSDCGGCLNCDYED